MQTPAGRAVGEFAGTRGGRRQAPTHLSPSAAGPAAPAQLFQLQAYTPPSWAAKLPHLPQQRYRLAQLPTPIHPWAVPGLPPGCELWIKRDDLTGMQLSGNKVRRGLCCGVPSRPGRLHHQSAGATFALTVSASAAARPRTAGRPACSPALLAQRYFLQVRKLEFLLAEAKEKGHDCIITIGGIQSNHARATAVAARYLGLDCHLILRNSRQLADSGACMPPYVGTLKLIFVEINACIVF